MESGGSNKKFIRLSKLEDGDEMSAFYLGNRKVGDQYPPLIVAEVGINHNGSFEKACELVRLAKQAGCECVKFQCHIPDKEMIPNDIIPDNANESIWDMMHRCAFSEEQERELKELVESEGMIYLSTP